MLKDFEHRYRAVRGRDVRFDNADEAKHTGASLTLSHLRVGIVGAGHVLNLRERELEEVVKMRELVRTPAEGIVIGRQEG